MRIPGNRLLIAPLPAQEKTSTGLFLPQESVGDKKLFWRVEQLGTGGELPKKPKTKSHGLRAGDYTVGQIVITPLHFSHHHLEDGTDRRIVGCDQIEGVLEQATL
jgi:hypothetical protein